MPIGPSIDIPTFMPASGTAATRAASSAPDTLGMAEMMVWLQVTMSRLHELCWPDQWSRLPDS